MSALEDAQYRANDVDAEVASAARALWEAYGYALPAAPTDIARTALEAVRGG